MILSLETKALLGDLLILGGFGVGCLGFLVLLPILYFRLTRKYDAMFPEYYRIIPFPSITGTVLRTGYYSSFIVFKNHINGKRHKIMYDVTSGYDFRGNASQLDIVLSYLYMFFAFSALGSLLIFILLTKVFGIDL